jgi:enoyl-CoA hydratase/carnithine racemase
MDSPKRLNAADAGMHEELVQIWRDVDADSQPLSFVVPATPSRPAATSSWSRR